MVTLLRVCSVLFIIINITSAHRTENSCKTPDDLSGSCIVVTQCRPLYHHLSGQIFTEQRDFLRQSHCGFDGTNPLVCCPNTFTINDLPNNSCGFYSPNKVWSGTQAALAEFTWMALLHYIRKPNVHHPVGFRCNGALIHEYYVLTAAHCIRGSKIAQNGLFIVDSVRLGEINIQSDPDCQEGECADPVLNIPVAEIIVHENYVPTSKSQENDIALIRLQRAAPHTDFIRPICLPVAVSWRNISYDRLRLEVTGFRQSESGLGSQVLLKSQEREFNWNECSNIFQNASINLSKKQFCTGGLGASYMGSGSPLVTDPGNTMGFDDDESSHVYTRVDEYIDWILDHMKK